jgi:hypothetical protein
MNCEHDRLLPNPALPDIEGLGWRKASIVESVIKV